MIALARDLVGRRRYEADVEAAKGLRYIAFAQDIVGPEKRIDILAV